jgi:dihydrolipoamide dehydrogenase
LNYGCIPTKTLIASAKVFSLVKKSSNFGIELDNPRLNWTTIQSKKDKVVLQLKLGMQSKLKGIDFINSSARIVSAQEIKVEGRIIKSKFILIATGSHPIQLAQLPFDGLTSFTINSGQGRRIDGKKIISSDEALILTQIPQSLLVVGGGVIGCEFASLFSVLGSQVTIIEKTSALLPAEDREVSRKIETIFKKKGITVFTGRDVSSLDLESYSKVLVCVGRSPQISGLGLNDLGVKLENNRIMVDEYLQSSLDNIYAAGDCTAKVMLAHYAAYQGVLAVENMILSNKRKADNLLVPSCIFTDPQIASVGVKENDAFACGCRIKVAKFDFRASAMAQITEETEGFVKIITNQENNRIIGASIVGPLATELIATLTVAIFCQLTASETGAIIFAHPTFSESLHEALK